jgi:hypothetical protein
LTKLVPAAGARTVRVSFVAAERVPEVPVRVTVATPAVAVVLAVKVIGIPAEVTAPKLAVTPAGRVAAKATAPENPLIPVMTTVPLAEEPRGRLMEAGVKARVKLGAVTVRVRGVLAVRVPEAPATVMG